MSTIIHLDNGRVITVASDTTTLYDVREAVNIKGGYLQSTTPDNDYNHNNATTAPALALLSTVTSTKIDIVAPSIKIPAGVYSFVSPKKREAAASRKRKADEIENNSNSSNNNNNNSNSSDTLNNVPKPKLRTANNIPEGKDIKDGSDEDYDDEVEIGSNNLEKLKISKRAPQITIKHLVEENYLEAGEAVEFKASGYGVVQGEITSRGTVRDTKKKVEYEFLNHWANAYKMKTINWAHVSVPATGGTMLDVKKRYYFDHPQLFE